MCVPVCLYLRECACVCRLQFQVIQRAFFVAVGRKLSEIPDFPDPPSTCVAFALRLKCVRMCTCVCA